MLTCLNRYWCSPSLSSITMVTWLGKVTNTEFVSLLLCCKVQKKDSLGSKTSSSIICITTWLLERLRLVLTLVNWSSAPFVKKKSLPGEAKCTAIQNQVIYRSLHAVHRYYIRTQFYASLPGSASVVAVCKQVTSGIILVSEQTMTIEKGLA